MHVQPVKSEDGKRNHIKRLAATVAIANAPHGSLSTCNSGVTVDVMLKCAANPSNMKSDKKSPVNTSQWVMLLLKELNSVSAQCFSEKTTILILNT